MKNQKLNIIILLFVIASVISVHAQSDLNAEQIYEKVEQAVVTIYTSDFSGKLLSQGSGVVLNDKGWVVTNYHVFSGGESMALKHKDKIVKYSSIIGLDADKDILILKVDDNTFPSVNIGDSDELKIGQKVYAIGSPMGYENTISEGIISGLRGYEEGTEELIQITAPISPGSSGGAVLDVQGNLIGISTKTLKGSQNLNFAIPINEILSMELVDLRDEKELEAFNHFNKGMSAFHAGNYDKAIEYYTKVLQLYPTDPKKTFSIYFRLGTAFFMKAYYDGAAESFKKAIELNPNIARFYLYLGLSQDRVKRYDDAIMNYKKTLELDPKFATAHFNLGVKYVDSGNYDEAINYFKKAVEINSSYTSAYLGLANAYAKKDYFDAAIVNYKKALEGEPKNTTAYTGLCYVYLNKSDYEQAIEAGKKAIELNPELAIAHYNLALAYKHMGNKKTSRYHYKRAFEINPNLKKK